ncbi:MAG: hypothetical protein WGN25_03645 [Candidatus Electrothrix sp. GW3-4]|uniref:hypothetical protein n=1 Tax=Candidatus Electrothrix sp. GW3-4 TaxID=3126740 RepID=UPI0030D0A874
MHFQQLTGRTVSAVVPIFSAEQIAHQLSASSTTSACSRLTTGSGIWIEHRPDPDRYGRSQRIAALHTARPARWLRPEWQGGLYLLE